jgi:hypothetical protein
VIFAQKDSDLQTFHLSLELRHLRMKRFLSISLALLLLASGMHVSVASHYCGGTLAQVKWSFNKELATCGMEGELGTAPKGILLEQPCCQDELSTYTTDGQYQLQSFELKKCVPQVIACFTAPVSLLFKSQKPVDYLYTRVFPPGIVFPTQVNQESICVFLI